MTRTSLPWLSAIVVIGIVAIPVRAEAFTLKFSWAGIPACQAASPAFELSDVPPGTKRLRFNMTDLDVPSFKHGGSTIAYETNAVKRGAITYVGPCPPDGQHHQYRWTVDALDPLGKVLGTATASGTFPP
jgi:phosphatidylethanolamine-binding protein (PEBP) family uncharacterized protein